LLKILHVSDVHFGPKHLPAPAAAVLALAHSARPDALVVSGDLTQRAKPTQFRAARAWIEAAPAPVVFTPGNHDVPMYRFWERLLAPFGAWRRHFAPALTSELVRPGLAIVALNTAHPWTVKHGRVAAKELAAVGRRLAALPAGGLRVLVAHHPLATGAELGGEPPARGGAAALELCRREGVELVLSGHLHRSFWLPVAAGREGPAIVHAGTTTSSRGRGSERGRCSLCWLEVDAERVRVERRFWEAESRAFATDAASELPRAAVG
jgi:3',5'-cyclic AMP phosphodiesterase CpdA